MTTVKLKLHRFAVTEKKTEKYEKIKVFFKKDCKVVV